MILEGPISTAARRCPALRNWSRRKDGTCKREPCNHASSCNDHRHYYNWHGGKTGLERILEELRK